MVKWGCATISGQWTNVVLVVWGGIKLLYDCLALSSSTGVAWCILDAPYWGDGHNDGAYWIFESPLWKDLPQRTAIPVEELGWEINSNVLNLWDFRVRLLILLDYYKAYHYKQQPFTPDDHIATDNIPEEGLLLSRFILYLSHSF